MSTPLVSICIPNLNTRRFLDERMQTILAQTLTDWELIVCDSYSEDGAWEFFQTFKNDPRIRLYQVPRAGIYAGWNECLKRVRGEYVYMATSDDTSDPRMLELLVGALKQHDDVEMATCKLLLIDEKGDRVDCADIRRRFIGDWLDRDHRRHRISEFVATCVGHTFCRSLSSVVFRSRLLSRIGLFPEKKGSIADYEWYLRACLSTDTIHVGQELATWRIHSQQATGQVDSERYGPFFATMVADVLATYGNLLPATLQTRNAQTKLLWPKTVMAFNNHQIYFRNFIKEPLRTLRRLGRGWRLSPYLTLRQAIRGFAWRFRPTIDCKSYYDDFEREFNLPPICSAITLESGVTTR